MDSAKPLRFTREARHDLDDIWDYSAERWGADQADRYINGLERAFQSIAEMPEIARERTEFLPPVRIHPSAQHLIVYSINKEIIQIIRVLYGRQNWAALLSQ